jgi:hypothetical protein
MRAAPRVLCSRATVRSRAWCSWAGARVRGVRVGGAGGAPRRSARRGEQRARQRAAAARAGRAPRRRRSARGASWKASSWPTLWRACGVGRGGGSFGVCRLSAARRRALGQTRPRPAGCWPADVTPRHATSPTSHAEAIRRPPLAVPRACVSSAFPAAPPARSTALAGHAGAGGRAHRGGAARRRCARGAPSCAAGCAPRGCRRAPGCARGACTRVAAAATPGAGARGDAPAATRRRARFFRQ